MLNAESAARVAQAIGVVKWVLINLAGLAGIVAVAGIALEDGEVSYSLTVALGVVAGTAAWCLLVWVVFGWFEHTLRALVAIASTRPPVPAPPVGHRV